MNDIIRDKHVVLASGKQNQIWQSVLRQKFSISVHLSEQQLFFSLYAFAYNKYLSQQIINRINYM